MRWPPNKTWTSTRKREGYRHFEVNQFGGKGSQRWIELYPVLKKGLSIRITIDELKNKNEWESGWQQLLEGECSEVKPLDKKDLSAEN